MFDYRLPENRMEYFTKLYEVNLKHKILPGLVYLYMPELAKHYGWDNEQKLWFATINGCTQNPITSLEIFNRYPEIPRDRSVWAEFDNWFNESWGSLFFDTDRRYAKKNTVKALHIYAKLVETAGSQEKLWSGKTYPEYWELAKSIYSFGRLSAFSYLEYVHIVGFGADCDDLVFEDRTGSRSHRNGMFFLLGQDDLVWDKRLPNGQTGNYPDFKPICSWVNRKAEEFLEAFKLGSTVTHAGKFTFESQCCTFKNSFFGRRFPGCYADMAMERIEKYDAAERQDLTGVFKDIRAAHLPDWLRIETAKKPLSFKDRGAAFPAMGFPYRGGFFL